jgi:disulfide bond formation protein DsbB
MLPADIKRARLLALMVPLALMAGALGSQFVGGLYPCEMCHWQRWPHYTAIGIAALAFLLGQRSEVRVLVALAALAILTSGAIGIYHAGVEYKFWEGLTTCSNMGGGAVTIEDIMATPLIRCDEPQWTLFGISLAGFNALISIPSALFILNLVRRAK